jgi:hypothetical protein
MRVFIAEYHFGPSTEASAEENILRRFIEAYSREEAAAKVALELTQGMSIYTAIEAGASDKDSAVTEAGEVIVVNAARVHYVRIVSPPA